MEYSRFALAEHAEFVHWLRRLPCLDTRLAIVRRLERLRRGHVGAVQALGKGVFALRLSCGPGFRLFVHRRGPHVTVLHACTAASDFAEHARHAVALALSIDARTLHEPPPAL